MAARKSGEEAAAGAAVVESHAKTRRKALGRGLAGLLGEDISIAEDPGKKLAEVKEISIDALIPGKSQPRTVMEDGALAELAASIRAQGVISPIIVREAPGGRYEIIAGERRFRAAGMAGLKSVPAIVRTVSDKKALALALIENMQREDLNAMEEAQGVRRLIEEFDYTHEEASDALGKSRSSVSNLLRLLTLAEPVQKLLREGKIEMGHARALAALDGASQAQLAAEIAARGLSVREAEKLAARVKNPPKKRNAARELTRDDENLVERLSETLGTAVRLQYGRGGRGKITIEFRNLDALDAILGKILPGEQA